MKVTEHYARNVKMTYSEKKIPPPTLDAVESLYVKAYLSSLSHIEAHRVVSPSLKNHSSDNPYSKRDNIQFYISKGLLNKTEALGLTSELIIERLYHEATTYGNGSNANARIAALQLLGKQLGMFQEKQQDTKPIFNIINYSSALPSKDATPLPVEVAEEIDTDSRIQLTQYLTTQEPLLEIEGDLDG